MNQKTVQVSSLMDLEWLIQKVIIISSCFFSFTAILKLFHVSNEANLMDAMKLLTYFVGGISISQRNTSTRLFQWENSCHQSSEFNFIAHTKKIFQFFVMGDEEKNGIFLREDLKQKKGKTEIAELGHQEVVRQSRGIDFGGT